MAKLKEYNGRYCESEFESAFISFLEEPIKSCKNALTTPVLSEPNLQ